MPLEPKCYADPDWAGYRTTRRSTTGWLCSLLSSPLFYASRTQSTVCWRAEAELTALSFGMAEALRLQQLTQRNAHTHTKSGYCGDSCGHLHQTTTLQKRLRAKGLFAHADGEGEDRQETQIKIHKSNDNKQYVQKSVEQCKNTMKNYNKKWESYNKEFWRSDWRSGSLRNKNYYLDNQAKMQIFVDFCWLLSFPWKGSTCEAQILAGNHRLCRKLQKTAGTRRKPLIGVCPLRFVPLSAAFESNGGQNISMILTWEKNVAPPKDRKMQQPSK